MRSDLLLPLVFLSLYGGCFAFRSLSKFVLRRAVAFKHREEQKLAELLKQTKTNGEKL